MLNAVREIKKIMTEKGITNTRLAAELGMSRQSLSQYFTRKPESLRLDVLQNVLDILGYQLTINEKSSDKQAHK